MKVQKIFSIAVVLVSLQATSKTIEEVIPVTVSNLKGHQILYNEGWSVITSTKESLTTAANLNTSAGQEMDKAVLAIKSNNDKFKSKQNDISKNVSDEKDSSIKAGNQRAQVIKSSTMEKTNEFKKLSQEKFSEAFAAFTLGYVLLEERTKDDWLELKAANSKYFSNLKSDLKDDVLVERLKEDFGGVENEVGLKYWQQSFASAKQTATKAIEESGNEENSFLALGTLFTGYAKATGEAIIKPGAESIVKISRKAVPVLIGFGLNVTKIIGHTVFCVGENIFYSTKLGYKVVSPTIEAGLLSSMGLLSAAVVPVVYTGGKAIGTINQVAIEAQPVVAGGKYVLATTEAAATQSAILIYDLASSTGKAATHEVKAGLVLGYNALTAIPTQTLLAAANSAVFLVYDGPRLGLAAIKGEINGVSVSQLKPGMVMDLQKVKSSGVEVNEILVDDSVLHEVLKKAGEDKK